MDQALKHSLSAGEFLEPEQKLYSTERHYYLKYQSDGNLVVYVGSNAVWSSGTFGKPAWRACMQDDGNFVVYSAPGKAEWSSGTVGNPGAKLDMQNDGNLVVYSSQGGALWDSRRDEKGEYDTHFTSDNQRLLRELKLLDVKLELSNQPVESVDIEWGQVNRSLLGNEEPYKECVYMLPGSSSHVKVFVANACGDPPASFNTSGVELNGGKLHFGYVYDDDDENVKAIFFVIQPPDRKPFQRRFRTTFMLGMLHAATEAGVARVSGAIIGAAVGSIVPVVGTAVGGAIGYCAGEVSSATFDSLYGDYLRYIG